MVNGFFFSFFQNIICFIHFIDFWRKKIGSEFETFVLKIYILFKLNAYPVSISVFKYNFKLKLKYHTFSVSNFPYLNIDLLFLEQVWLVNKYFLNVNIYSSCFIKRQVDFNCHSIYYVNSTILITNSIM